MMTVRKLIERLATMPPGLQVAVTCHGRTDWAQEIVVLRPDTKGEVDGLFGVAIVLVTPGASGVEHG